MQTLTQTIETQSHRKFFQDQPDILNLNLISQKKNPKVKLSMNYKRVASRKHYPDLGKYSVTAVCTSRGNVPSSGLNINGHNIPQTFNRDKISYSMFVQHSKHRSTENCQHKMKVHSRQRKNRFSNNKLKSRQKISHSPEQTDKSIAYFTKTENFSEKKSYKSARDKRISFSEKKQKMQSNSNRTVFEKPQQNLTLYRTFRSYRKNDNRAYSPENVRIPSGYKTLANSDLNMNNSYKIVTQTPERSKPSTKQENRPFMCINKLNANESEFRPELMLQCINMKQVILHQRDNQQNSRPTTSLANTLAKSRIRNLKTASKNTPARKKVDKEAQEVLESDYAVISPWGSN